MVRGEEQQFDGTIGQLISYANNIKLTLVLLIQRIETDSNNIDWPQILDSFTTICGQINTIMRYARDNKTQHIENRVILPLLLSPDRDEELTKLTEGRVQLVDHEMVPGYLRTKPDPEIEELEKALIGKANTITPDAAIKLINATDKLLENTIKTIKSNMIKADNEMNKQPKPSYNHVETNELLSAICNGKGLRPASIHRSMAPGMPEQMPMIQQQISQRPNVKAPELKTNIKTGP